MATHAARIDTSPRLKRVAEYLADGEEHTTLDIARATDVCAVNSIVSELRANGYGITCKRRGSTWVYRLVKRPENGI